jgi:hypothetical protein
MVHPWALASWSWSWALLGNHTNDDVTLPVRTRYLSTTTARG